MSVKPEKVSSQSSQVGPHHQPLRTCIATRTVAPASQLLRCVAQHNDDGTVEIVPDPQRRLPGRGAWITPQRDLIKTANDRQAFRRAFKLKVGSVGIAQVLEYLDERHQAR